MKGEPPSRSNEIAANQYPPPTLINQLQQRMPLPLVVIIINLWSLLTTGPFSPGPVLLSGSALCCRGGPIYWPREDPCPLEDDQVHSLQDEGSLANGPSNYPNTLRERGPNKITTTRRGKRPRLILPAFYERFIYWPARSLPFKSRCF